MQAGDRSGERVGDTRAPYPAVPLVGDRIVRIEDADDARLEPYRAVRERDLVGRQGRFVAEGEVVLRILLSGRARFATEYIHLAEQHVERLAGILATVPHEVPVYAAPRPVLDGIVGFPIHRGILAIGHRGAVFDPAAALAALPESALVVALIGLANHDNVGAVFRNAAAFGADLVLLDETCCDPLYRKAIRVSVGACLTVPFARAGCARTLVGLLVASGLDVTALSPSGKRPIERRDWTPRSAILLGSEGPGLPREILARIATVRIDMAEDFDSLNVGTASGIALHAAASARHCAADPTRAGRGEPATGGDGD